VAHFVPHSVPHQADGETLPPVLGRLGLGAARTRLPLDRHGNTGAASVPPALDHARHGPAGPADDELVLLAGFGGGTTVATTLLRRGD
jgi:3-oxoacyl-[acyl-carrier-protein] synthase-3